MQARAARKKLDRPQPREKRETRVWSSFEEYKAGDFSSGIDTGELATRIRDQFSGG